MSWFEKTKKEFTAAALLKKGCGVYVEVGVWTGDSAEWVMQNIQPQAAYGFDPYPSDQKHPQEEVDGIYQAALDRLRPLGFKLYRYDSQTELRLWPATRGKIDLLYLDGRHDACGVMLDFCLAWEHLADDAIVIFDDYGIGKRKWHRHVPEAVEALKMSFGDQLDWFHNGPLQVACRLKTKVPPVEPKMQRFDGIKARAERRRLRGEAIAAKAAAAAEAT